MYIHAVQLQLKLGDVDYNLEKVFYILSSRKIRHSSLVLLPEMFSCGFDNQNLQNHSKFTPKVYRELQNISKEKSLVIAGTLPERKKGDVYNMGFVIDNGEITAKRPKVKLFTPTDEHRYFKAGKNNFHITESSVGNLGFMICFELRFPNISYYLRKKDVEIILVPAQWGKDRVEHLKVLSRARAIETQSFLVLSNTVGSIGDVEYGGYSAIYSPWGDILDIERNDEGVISADVELDEVYRIRNKIKMEY
ncbi:MAG: nitrilase [Hydrogenothermaceae bacterium]|nr:nitrilase [Hydrogenothermaceae bacterium]